MTEEAGASFGPYAFALTPEEAEAAAARYGLRRALAGGLTARHHAPLAAFTLAVLFASILAFTGLIGRRAGEIAILLSAMAFMVQRLMTHWRLHSARVRAREAFAQSRREQTILVGPDGVAVESGGTARRVAFDDVDDAEDAGGLVYLWLRAGDPVVIPTRVLPGAQAEAARLVSRVGRGRLSPSAA